MKNKKQNKKLIKIILITASILLALFLVINVKGFEKKKDIKTEQEILNENNINENSIQSNDQDTYTQKDLDEDLKLSIEQLRQKYPIEWWESKFGSIDKVNGGACDNNEGYNNVKNFFGIECEPEKRISELTNNEIISIFVHFQHLSYNADGIVDLITKDIIKKQEYSKWFNLKKLIYSKTILENSDRLKSKLNNKQM